MTVIDRELIQPAAPAASLIFRLVPGFQVAPRPRISRVTYHGLSDDDFSTRVQVPGGRAVRSYSPLFQGGVNGT